MYVCVVYYGSITTPLTEDIYNNIYTLNKGEETRYRTEKTCVPIAVRENRFLLFFNVCICLLNVYLAENNIIRLKK